MPASIHRHYWLDLIWYRAVCQLKTEAAKSYLGFLWWFIDPLLYLAVFYVVFAMVLKRGGDDFVAFLLTGLVIWKWFDVGVREGADSLRLNTPLIQQVYLKKIVFPVSAVLASSLKTMLVMVALICFLLIYGPKISATWLMLFPLIAAQFVLILGISVLLSSVVPFFPDLTFLIAHGLQLMFFISGIFFDIADVKWEYAAYLHLNPMLVLIDAYRDALLMNTFPGISAYAYPLVVGISLGLLGVLILRRYDREYARISLA